ncbi:MAG: thiamine pyrophosphate-dependent enzyme, partial [Gammaproteobacteria bacterium]
MNRDLARKLLYDMHLARAFEQRVAEEYAQGSIGGFLHLYPGEEAVAVGVLNAADLGDYVVSTYREHVHALVRGIPARAVMAELFGKAGGCSGGYGGSMHLFDRERRFLGGYAIVGETFPVAVGAAYWLKMNDAVDAVLCFFGDGAANQGTFHECLN